MVTTGVVTGMSGVGECIFGETCNLLKGNLRFSQCDFRIKKNARGFKPEMNMLNSCMRFVPPHTGSEKNLQPP